MSDPMTTTPHYHPKLQELVAYFTQNNDRPLCDISNVEELADSIQSELDDLETARARVDELNQIIASQPKQERRVVNWLVLNGLLHIRCDDGSMFWLSECLPESWEQLPPIPQDGGGQ